MTISRSAGVIVNVPKETFVGLTHELDRSCCGQEHMVPMLVRNTSRTLHWQKLLYQFSTLDLRYNQLDMRQNSRIGLQAVQNHLVYLFLSGKFASSSVRQN